jgi:hypothetical protein
MNEVKSGQRCLKRERRSRISLTLIRATTLSVARISRHRDQATLRAYGRRANVFNGRVGMDYK